MPLPFDNQYLSDRSDADLVRIIDTIGRDRLTPYRLATLSDRDMLALYAVNSRLSKHIHDVIGGFEVALRNAVSDSLERHYRRPDWYRARSFVMALATERRRNIAEVRKRLRFESRDERTGRIVAGLTFHFWVSMHENKYRDVIWTAHLHRIWPKGENIKRVHKDLLKIRDLRNRIAHHEPIIHAIWHQRVDTIWARFDQIAPAMASWYRARLEEKITHLRALCETRIEDGGKPSQSAHPGEPG